jgi:hypothetical protein
MVEQPFAEVAPQDLLGVVAEVGVDVEVGVSGEFGSLAPVSL